MPFRRDIPDALKGLPVVALSCVFFAGMAALARYVSPVVPSSELVLIRFVTGMVAMAGYYLARGHRPKAPRVLPWVGRGLFGGAAVFFYFAAIHALEVGPATVLNYSSPIYAAILAALFLGEPLTGRIAAGIAIATVGSALVALSASGPGATWFSPGALAGMLSAVLGGAAMTTVRSLRKDTSAASIYVSFCLFGAVVSLPAALHDWRALDLRTWALAIGVGLFSIAAQLLITYAFAFVSTARVAVVTQLTPPFTWLLGVALLHESLTLEALLGAGICIAGVILGSLPASARLRPSRLPSGSP